VRYDIDPTTGSLLRSVSPVSNLEAIGQPTPTPQAVLAERIANLTLRFWDVEQKTWRNDWDYQQQNQAQETSSQTGQTGQTGQTDPQNSQPTTTTGDTALPAAIEVTLVLARKDGSPATYTTLIPIVAPRPSTTQTQPAATNNTGGTGTGNTGGTGAGGNTGNTGNSSGQGPRG
jgi:hypothetical protein